MTVVVTRDVPARFRGFLASCMLEIAPGVYTGSRMTAAVRERLWAVLSEWHGHRPRGSILLTWRDPKLPGGQGLRTLGHPAKELIDYDGMLLVRGRIGA